MCVSWLRVFVLINVKPQGVDPQPQLGALLVLDFEVVDAVHLQVLSDLQVLHHGVLPAHAHTQALLSRATFQTNVKPAFDMPLDRNSASGAIFSSRQTNQDVERHQKSVRSHMAVINIAVVANKTSRKMTNN